MTRVEEVIAWAEKHNDWKKRLFIEAIVKKGELLEVRLSMIGHRRRWGFQELIHPADLLTAADWRSFAARRLQMMRWNFNRAMKMERKQNG